MKHFYYKFLIKNKGIELWLKKNEQEIDLSIYYGKWKKTDYPDNIGNQNFLRKDQIDRFFNLKKESEQGKEIYFWTFHKEIIYCFKGINLDVYDGPKEYNNKDKNNKIESVPKSIRAQKVMCLSKIDHPEFFSNINSNQSYNRRTLTELKDSAEEYATSLISNKIISVGYRNFYKYLSPTQFETLIFLIFTNKNSLCSSFRGGTLKDYDLRVFLDKEFYGIPTGKHWLQVKLKTIKKSTIEGFTIHVGKTKFKDKIIGIDWIADRIKEREDILRWLTKCVFNYELLKADFRG